MKIDLNKLRVEDLENLPTKVKIKKPVPAKDEPAKTPVKKKKKKR
jgi:hypothetical protein